MQGHQQDTELGVPDAGIPAMACQTAVIAAWNWHPAFPQRSSCLGSSNHIAGRITEMELCLSLAASYKRTKNMKAAVGMVKASSSLLYLDAVANYVKAYAGGETFPLLHLLFALEKFFNSS